MHNDAATSCDSLVPPPGQQTLPGMADVVGYDSVVLSPDDEAFVWARIRHQGNGTEAYLALHPELTEQWPDEKRRRKIAADRAARIAVKRGVEERSAQVQELIGREWLAKIKDFHGTALTFDPMSFYKFSPGGHLVEREVHEIPEELRRLCNLDTRLVDKRLVTVLVPPDKYKSAAELAKMLGAYAPEKTELSGSVTNLVAEIVFTDPPGEPPVTATPVGGEQADHAAVPLPTWDDDEDE